MNGLLEAATRFYQPYVDAWCRTAEQNLHMQQEVLRAWARGIPGLSGVPTSWPEQLQKAGQQWARDMADLTRKYQESWETHYKSGVQVLDDLFRMPESRDPGQLQRRLVEFYRKALEHLRDLNQAQAREFQNGVNRWMEGLSPPS